MVLTLAHLLRTVPAVVAAGGLLAFSGATASAAEAPSDWWQARMNRELATRSVRVRGDFGHVELIQPRVDGIGIHAEAFGAVRASRRVPRFSEIDPRTIGWDGVESLEVSTNATGFGALVGGFAGVATAIAVNTLVGPTGSNASELRAASLAAGGAALGALAGVTRRRWHAYYPVPDDGIPLHPVSSAP